MAGPVPPTSRLVFITDPTEAASPFPADVVEQLYGAAGDESALFEVLNQLAERIRTPLVAIHTYNLTTRAGGAVAVRGWADASLQRYRDYYSSVNVWMKSSPDLLQPHHITLSHLMYPDELLPETEWYCDFLRPAGVFHSLGVVIRMESSNIATLNFLRPRDAGNFDETEQRLVRTLGPHIANAFRLHGQLDAVQAQASGFLQALDRFPQAVFLLGADGRVVTCNQAAKELSAERDGLFIRDGMLESVLVEPRKELRRLLLSSAVPTQHRDHGLGGSLRIPRSSHRMPFHLWVVPLLPHRRTPGTGGVTAVVFVSDPNSRRELAADVVEKLFGLTPREAALVIVLSRGGDLQEAAQALGISVNTAKTHLANVYLKTGVHSRCELIALLARGIASLRL